MHNLPVNDETDIIRNIFKKSVNESVVDTVLDVVAKFKPKPDYTRNTNPALAPKPKTEPLSPDLKDTLNLPSKLAPAVQGVVEVGTGLAAKKTAQAMGVVNPWALTGIEAAGQVGGGWLTGAKPSIPGAVGGVGLMNLAAKPSEAAGAALARSIGAGEGSWQEALGGVAGSIVGSVGGYLTGYKAGQKVGSVVTDATSKLAKTKLVEPVAKAIQTLGKSGLGRGLGIAGRVLGVPAAMATAAETGWQLGRYFGNKMSIGSDGVQWVGDKTDPKTITARQETEEMGPIDLAKETLGYGKAGRAAQQEKATKEWGTSQQAKQAQANAQYQKLRQAQTQTERQTGQLSQETILQAEKDLKERGVEGFKAAYGNDPQLMSWLQTQTRGTEMSLREQYYNHFMKMFNEEVSIETSAYGLTKKGKKRMAHYIASRENPTGVYGVGDSSDVEDLEPETDTPQEKVSDPETFVKHQVIKLMTQAQEQGVKMTHGQAHKMALDTLKKRMSQ